MRGAATGQIEFHYAPEDGSREPYTKWVVAVSYWVRNDNGDWVVEPSQVQADEVRSIELWCGKWAHIVENVQVEYDVEFVRYFNRLIQTDGDLQSEICEACVRDHEKQCSVLW